MAEQRDTSRKREAFLIALGLSCMIFLPFVMLDKGLFIYFGDFNVQQIPFYQLAHRAVRSGQVFWNWNTDLGVNFIGSYSFYLLFSPFFWLTLPFPNSIVPYLMAPLLALKTACASLTGYMYIERFVRDRRYAVLGGLLYAFSGWMSFNVFFNHFHEVAVFFPLLLLGVEKLVCEDNKAFFALAVALNAAVNYWFFIGEVVFVVLYVIVRTLSGGWGMTAKKFVRLAFESMLGVACAAVVLLPSALALLGNPRTGADSLISGWNAWLYWHEQRPAAILHSVFFPPELQAFPSFFPDHGARWASLSAWLPMLGAVGVLGFFLQRRARSHRWLSRMLGLSLLFAMVPALNHLFVLLNESYYARWFHMPLLLMAAATALALETDKPDSVPFRRALAFCAVVIVLTTLAVGLTPQQADGVWQLGLAEYPVRMWASAAFALAGLALSAWLLLRLRHKPYFVRAFGAALALYTLVFNIWYIACGRASDADNAKFADTILRGQEKISLPQDGFARSDIYEGEDNALMYWRLPGIQAFHSIVPVSLMEFYPQVGVTRDVASRPGSDLYALRPLLSVRWLFIAQENSNQIPMPGYIWYDRQNGYEIYENEFYLPMGFAYDYYIEQDALDAVVQSRRANLLLRAVLLEPDAAERNADILRPLTAAASARLDPAQMALDVQDRLRYTATDFETDARGFSASTSFPAPKLVFFSVPREGGWSATVNGEPAVIEKANIGFMAVRVPAGPAEIRFDYMTPGLRGGAIISGAGLLLWLVYALAFRRGKAEREPLDLQRELLSGRTVRLSWDEYLNLYSKEQRRQALRLAMNELAALQMDEPLPEKDRTIRFVLPDEPEPPDGPG